MSANPDLLELLKNIRTNPDILLNISSEIRTFLPGRHFIYAFAYKKMSAWEKCPDFIELYFLLNL